MRVRRLRRLIAAPVESFNISRLDLIGDCFKCISCFSMTYIHRTISLDSRSLILLYILSFQIKKKKLFNVWKPGEPINFEINTSKTHHKRFVNAEPNQIWFKLEKRRRNMCDELLWLFVDVDEVCFVGSTHLAATRRRKWHS